MLNKETLIALITLIFSILTVSIDQCNAWDHKTCDVIKTKLGIVKVIKDEPSLPTATLTVNGRRIFHSKEPYAFLYRSFETNNYIAVLFGENAGGSGTPVDTLYFLLLRSNKKPMIITNKDFYSADGTMGIKQRRNDIVFDLGFEEKKRKTAMLTSGKVVVRYAIAKVRPMKLEDCKQVYEYASAECLQHKELKLDCNKYGRNYMGDSGNSSGFIMGISHHPGFVDSALGNKCVKTCNTGKIVSFKQFKKDVCSIK